MTAPAVSASAIRVEGLEKSYKDLHVLRGVDFDVARGSIFALLGSNGAGKTTVVNILSTLLKADAGTASVNGFDVASQAADVRESISLTGQFAAVDEVLTGRENLVLVARLRHLKDPVTVTITDDLLERFALTDAAARKVATYSGGMRRRLDIAMSLIGNPQVIFLDEPTTGLDPQGRIEVWQAVKDLAEHGTTVLLTTQDLDEAEQLADRIAILHEGRIIVNGTLTELKRLLPPAKVEYVEKQPTLEEVFFAIVGDDAGGVEGKDRDALATSIAPLAALAPRGSRLLSAPTSSSLRDEKACPLASPQHGAGRDPGTAASQQMTKEQQ
jgi:ABC-2 type transport system ATP-binding protein